MLKIMTIGAGGFLGTTFRYLLTLLLGRLSLAFPWNTFVVNAVGCLTLGVIIGLAESRWDTSHGAYHFLTWGLIGGFTTFSAFTYETLALLRNGLPLRATGNLVLTIVVGLIALCVGERLGRLL